MNGKFIILFVVGAIVLAIGGNYLVSLIPGEGRAVQAVENLGYHNAKVISRSPAFENLGGCHTDDVTKFTVRGVAVDGRVHNIEVCAPIIGGYTVRN